MPTAKEESDERLAKAYIAGMGSTPEELKLLQAADEHQIGEGEIAYGDYEAGGAELARDLLAAAGDAWERAVNSVLEAHLVFNAVIELLDAAQEVWSGRGACPYASAVEDVKRAAVEAQTALRGAAGGFPQPAYG